MAQGPRVQREASDRKNISGAKTTYINSMDNKAFYMKYKSKYQTQQYKDRVYMSSMSSQLPKKLLRQAQIIRNQDKNTVPRESDKTHNDNMVQYAKSICKSRLAISTKNIPRTGILSKIQNSLPTQNKKILNDK